MKKAIFHGEVAFFEVDEIPVDAEKVSVNSDFYVVGESETHGNDHRICVDERTKLFTKDDVLFLETIGTEVYCPNRTRHATRELPGSKYRVGHASEYDYFSESLRKVRD